MKGSIQCSRVISDLTHFYCMGKNSWNRQNIIDRKSCRLSKWFLCEVFLHHRSSALLTWPTAVLILLSFLLLVSWNRSSAKWCGTDGDSTSIVLCWIFLENVQMRVNWAHRLHCGIMGVYDLLRQISECVTITKQHHVLTVRMMLWSLIK